MGFLGITVLQATLPAAAPVATAAQPLLPWLLLLCFLLLWIMLRCGCSHGCSSCACCSCGSCSVAAAPVAAAPPVVPAHVDNAPLRLLPWLLLLCLLLLWIMLRCGCSRGCCYYGSLSRGFPFRTCCNLNTSNEMIHFLFDLSEGNDVIDKKFLLPQ